MTICADATRQDKLPPGQSSIHSLSASRWCRHHLNRNLQLAEGVRRAFPRTGKRGSLLLFARDSHGNIFITNKLSICWIEAAPPGTWEVNLCPSVGCAVLRTGVEDRRSRGWVARANHVSTADLQMSLETQSTHSTPVQETLSHLKCLVLVTQAVFSCMLREQREMIRLRIILLRHMMQQRRSNENLRLGGLHVGP